MTVDPGRAVDEPNLPPGALSEAYARFSAMEAALEVGQGAPPETVLAAEHALKLFSQNVRADCSLLFVALIETADLKDRFKYALLEMVQAYGGYIPDDDPFRRQFPQITDSNTLYEIRMFQAFLKACGILGISMRPANRQARQAQEKNMDAMMDSRTNVN